MDVLIFCGQSNMQGESEGLPFSNAVVQNAKQYLFCSDSLVPLKHPVGEDIYCNEQLMLAASCNGCGTLVPAFCRQYIETTCRNVVAIHVAKGATTIADWLPDTLRYKCAVNKILSGIRLANATEKVQHVYLVWLQGESDAVSAVSTEEYLKKLVTLKDALKRDVGLHKFGIIQVGYFASQVDWLNDSVDVRRTHDENIMLAQQLACKQEDFVLLTDVCKTLSVNTDFINPNVCGHYNNVALDLIGQTAGKALAKIANN